MRSTVARKLEKYLDAKNKKLRDMWLSKNPKIAQLETQMFDLADRIKKEGISG